MNHDTVLSKNDIPSEIINEINRNYSGIDWSVYGMSYDELGKERLEKMKSYRLQHTVINDDYGPKEVIDAEDFTAKTIMANSETTYFCRGCAMDNGEFMVWRIQEVGPIVRASPHTESTE